MLNRSVEDPDGVGTIIVSRKPIAEPDLVAFEGRCAR